MIDGTISERNQKVMRRIQSHCLLLAITAAALSAAALPGSKPEDLGFSSERLQRIHLLVQRHIDAGDITGAVMLVARHGQIAYLDVEGTMDLDTKKPMTRDSLFRMASMTKPVIGTSIMMMLEEGKLQLGDPVSKYIPEFKNMKVAILQEPGQGQGKPPKFYTVPAEREITLKDLLTHTSGLSSGPMGQSEVAKIRRQPTETLADYIPRLATTPLEFQPGTRWQYSPSDGFDVLARIVEIASGVPLNAFLKQRLFEPLDMPETSHYPSDAQMLANGGEFRGHRLLSPITVKLMSSVHIPYTLPGRTTGEGFGLSVRVMQDAIVGNHRISDGSFGWSGAYGTHFWVDPKQDLVALMFIQTPIREMRPEFENAVMQAIVK